MEQHMLVEVADQPIMHLQLLQALVLAVLAVEAQVQAH
jgi:hypothetical protein